MSGQLFEDQVRILHNPELRHVLAHLWAAIEATAQGLPTLAEAELASIEGLVFYESGPDAERILLAAKEKDDGHQEQAQMHEASTSEEEVTASPVEDTRR